MELLDLPDEILITIIKGFDIVTLSNLYYTCQRMKNIFSMYGLIKQAKFSCNVLATVNTLKQDFFRGISCHLLELNLSAVPDLTKAPFIKAMSKLKNLKILDISYTNLNLLDLLVIQKKCQNLKDITINFTFGKSLRVLNNTLNECQSAFKQYENIHFVGSVSNLFHTKLAYYLLAKAKLNTLKYTIVECSHIIHIVDDHLLECATIPQFNQFKIYIVRWIYKLLHSDIDRTWNEFVVLDMLDLENYEYIILFVKVIEPIVYASSMFHKFLKDNFNEDAKIFDQNEYGFFVNVAIMIWNKETTNFDELFYEELTKHLRLYFPHVVPSEHGLNKLEDDPSKHDWFYILPNTHVIYRPSDNPIRNRRQALPNLELQYDSFFQEKKQIEMTLRFEFPLNAAIALTEGCQYLKKLTYLNLSDFGRYASDFFIVLFRCCHNLVTLNVEPRPMSSCAATISRSLPITRSLKNIRIVDKHIDFKALFTSFSQCPTLENIHVADSVIYANNDLADPTIVLAKCNNLYSFYIEANLTEATKTRIVKMFNKAKRSFNKGHVNVNVHEESVQNDYSYDPLLEVFKLNSIKPI